MPLDFKGCAAWRTEKALVECKINIFFGSITKFLFSGLVKQPYIMLKTRVKNWFEKYSDAGFTAAMTEVSKRPGEGRISFNRKSFQMSYYFKPFFLPISLEFQHLSHISQSETNDKRTYENKTGPQGSCLCYIS